MKLHELPAYDDRGEVRIVIEVPKGSGSKFKYDPETGFFSLHRSLPKGLQFPCDYGFVPSTLGEDGDPLDGVILVDTALFCGCVVTGRLIGLIEATQRGEQGGRVQNGILLAVHDESINWKNVKRLTDLPSGFLDQLEFFFSSYRNFQGKEFRVQGLRGSTQGHKLIRQGTARYQKQNASPP